MTQTSDSKEQDKIELKDLKAGYIVGLTADDKLVFEILGEKKAVLEVFGAHELAKRQIERLYSATSMSGDALVNEVGRAVQQLHVKMKTLMDEAGVEDPSQEQQLPHVVPQEPTTEEG